MVHQAQEHSTLSANSQSPGVDEELDAGPVFLGRGCSLGWKVVEQRIVNSQEYLPAAVLRNESFEECPERVAVEHIGKPNR